MGWAKQGGVSVVTTVIVDKSGRLDLPQEVLEASRIRPGTELVVIAEAGRLTLVDRQQLLSDRARALDEETQARLRDVLQQRGTEPFFAGLSLDEYLALSDEDDKALWDRLHQEAEREVKDVEIDIPPHFRPAGQGNGPRGAARRRSR